MRWWSLPLTGLPAHPSTFAAPIIPKDAPIVQTTVDPAHCVALGAAIYAGILEGTITNGPELADGSYSWDLHARASGFCQ